MEPAIKPLSNRCKPRLHQHHPTAGAEYAARSSQESHGIGQMVKDVESADAVEGRSFEGVGQPRRVHRLIHPGNGHELAGDDVGSVVLEKSSTGAELEQAWIAVGR